MYPIIQASVWVAEGQDCVLSLLVANNGCGQWAKAHPCRFSAAEDLLAGGFITADAAREIRTLPAPLYTPIGVVQIVPKLSGQMGYRPYSGAPRGDC